MSYTFYVPGDESMSLNMSNVNAEALLEVLGYELGGDGPNGIDPWCGHLDPDDVEGRALVAIAVAPDPELVATADTLPGGATRVDCGRPAGYLTERARRMIELARRAKELRTHVAYC